MLHTSPVGIYLLKLINSTYGLLENRKACRGLNSFFILDSIQTVLSNNNDTLGRKINLNFSPKVCPEKQVTFSVETPKFTNK